MKKEGSGLGEEHDECHRGLEMRKVTTKKTTCV